MGPSTPPQSSSTGTPLPCAICNRKGQWLEILLGLRTVLELLPAQPGLIRCCKYLPDDLPTVQQHRLRAAVD